MVKDIATTLGTPPAAGRSPFIPPELQAYFHDFDVQAGISTILIGGRGIAPPGFYGVQQFIVPDDCDIVTQGMRASVQVKDLEHRETSPPFVSGEEWANLKFVKVGQVNLGHQIALIGLTSDGVAMKKELAYQNNHSELLEYIEGEWEDILLPTSAPQKLTDFYINKAFGVSEGEYGHPDIADKKNVAFTGVDADGNLGIYFNADPYSINSPLVHFEAEEALSHENIDEVHFFERGDAVEIPVTDPKIIEIVGSDNSTSLGVGEYRAIYIYDKGSNNFYQFLNGLADLDKRQNDEAIFHFSTIFTAETDFPVDLIAKQWVNSFFNIVAASGTSLHAGDFFSNAYDLQFIFRPYLGGTDNDTPLVLELPFAPTQLIGIGARIENSTTALLEDFLALGDGQYAFAGIGRENRFPGYVHSYAAPLDHEGNPADLLDAIVVNKEYKDYIIATDGHFLYISNALPSPRTPPLEELSWTRTPMPLAMAATGFQSNFSMTNSFFIFDGSGITAFAALESAKDFGGCFTPNITHRLRIRLIDKTANKEFFGSTINDMGLPVELMSAGIKREGWHMRDTIPLEHWLRRRTVLQVMCENKSIYPAVFHFCIDCLAMYRGAN